MRSLVSRIRIVLCLLAVQPLFAFLHAAGTDSVVVTLARAPGYGPFTPVVRLSYPGENGGAWVRAIPEMRGIPVDLHGFSVRFMNLQADQHLFQSYREGLIDPGFALEAITREKIDTTRLTAKYVSQDVPVVAGYDQDGNIAYVVDTKADHSFWGKDRIVVTPFRPGTLTRAQMDSLNDAIDKPVVGYEYFDGRKIQEAEVAVRICPYVNVPAERAEEMRGKIVFGIGTFEYRRGVFTNGERKYMCAVSNGFQSGVYGAQGDRYAFFPAEDSSTASPRTSLLYRMGDRVEIANEIFRISSLSIDGGSLSLRREKPVPGGPGIAVGSMARDFEGKTLAGDRVSLAGFRGKYLLLNFWYPGSPGSAAEIPYMNDVHDALGGSNLTVLGMVPLPGDSLAPFAAAHRIRWMQVPLGDTSRVLRDYAVVGCPSAFLINPGGMIVENGNLGSGDLAAMLSSALGDTSVIPLLIGKGNVAFRFDVGRQKRVEVTGDFTGWLPLPMYRTGTGFVRRVALSPGRYHYVYLVDGEQVLDPSGAETEDSSGRSVNVLVVP